MRLDKIAENSLPKLKEYGRFLSWQSIIILLNTISGFIVIRALSKTDYAYYTIVFTTISMFTNITNTGIEPAINAIGGKIWNDPNHMRILINSALDFRKKIGYYVALPILIYCIWQLLHNGVPENEVVLFIISLVVGGAVLINTGIYSLVHRLNNNIRKLQLADIWSSSIKLLGIIVLSLAVSNAYIFLWWIVLVMYVQYLLIWHWSKPFLSKSKATDKKISTSIYELFRPNIINTVYWAFQGQILVFICALFGSTENIGEVGAMGRIAILFSPFSMLITNYFQPAVAKAQSSLEIQTNISKAFVFLCIPIFLILGAAFFFPQLFLVVLGNQYLNLENYLFLFLVISLTSLLQGIIYSFCSARGWVKLYYLYTPVVLFLQIGMLVFFKIDNLFSILVFKGISEAGALLLSIVIFMVGFQRFRKNESLQIAGNNDR